jgi:hypothetical protein
MIGLAALTACSPTPTTTKQAPISSSAASGTPGSSPTAAGPTTKASEPVTITHIHTVARDPKTGELLLATHEGLFRQSAGELHQSGPVIDLMSFAIAPDGTYYASGHPGTGTDLPEPVGLLSSTDSGRTWKVLSRGGQSDFHALGAGPRTITGFDGTLRTTSNRTDWTTRAIPAPPRTLAAAPTTGTLLATTRAGLLLSTDDGASWRTLSPPETAVLVAWADEQTIIAATATGKLASSTDAGATWTLHPNPIGPASALYAQRGSDQKVEIIAVVGTKVLRTTNNGETTNHLVS